MRPEYIVVGTVVNAHGIRGEVKVNPRGFDPEFIASFKTLYIGGKPVTVKAARVHKSTVLLTLPGVETMDDALALKGKDIAIRRADAELPEESCYTDESHWNGLLEYPQYSRPEEWHGRKVPEVLLSGHHGNVADWRTKESYKRTMVRRPDLWEKFDLTQVHSRHDKRVLAQALAEFEAERQKAALAETDE